MFFGKLKKCLLLIILLGVNLNCFAQDKVLQASNFISPKDPDVSLGLYNLFKKAKEGNFTKIVFEKGVYHVYDEHAFEQFMFISNHDSGRRKIAFPILNFDSLEIDGAGSQFIIHGLVIPITVENSKNIIIKNLFFDHFRATHSELKVKAIDKKNHTIDFEIDAEYPYEIRNGELIFLKRGFEHSLEREIYFDPNTNAVAFQSRKMLPLDKKKNSISTNLDLSDSLYPIDKNSPIYKKRGSYTNLTAEQLNPGLVRISGVNENLPEIGWVLVVKGENGNNRLAPGVRLLNSSDILIDNVTVHHASGMGLIAEGCTNVSLNAFNVEPKQGSSRILSTTADATHFIGCRGKIKIENCSFKNQLDDATNIHGTYMEIVDVYSSLNKIGAKLGHFQQIGYDFARTGDTIALVNPKISAKHVFYLTIKKVEKINPQYFLFTFNEVLSDNISAGLYIENIEAYPEVEIRNCKILNNRARGFLISSPRKVTIENNVFSCMMAAILCPNEFTFWYESGYVKDLTIMNNVFLDNTYGNAKPTPVIGIYAVSKGGGYIHDHIIIKNNIFENYSSNILFAEHVRSLTFKDNKIKYSGTYPMYGDYPILSLKEVGESFVINNIIDNRFGDLLKVEPTTSKVIEKENTRF